MEEKKLSLSQQIAQLGADLKYEDLPERVVKNSKMFILDGSSWGTRFIL